MGAIQPERRQPSEESGASAILRESIQGNRDAFPVEGHSVENPVCRLYIYKVRMGILDVTGHGDAHAVKKVAIHPIPC